MAKPLKMTKLQETFRVLGLRSNLASVEVLRWALMSPFEQVRLNALNTLIQRGGPADMAAVVERIDACSEAELNLLMCHLPLLMIPIEAGLAERDPVTRQRSLVAIEKLQIAPLFHYLVEAAEMAEDPQQMVAAELLIILASKLGAAARFGASKAGKSIREQLLGDLWQSMTRYNDHRISDIVDAWLCASHWDDKPFREVFTPACGDTIHKIVIRQLRYSHRAQIMELVAGILWSHGPGQEMLRELGGRMDQSMSHQLAALVDTFGVTPSVTKNLLMQIPMKCLEHVEFSNPEMPILSKRNLLKLLSVSNASPDIILRAINQMLQWSAAEENEENQETAQACSVAIRNLRSLKPEIVVMVLSDCFEMPHMEPYEPPPWKTSLRVELEKLLELYPHQSESVQSSIEYIFSDFRCEELLKHLEDWPESHLNAYAKIVRIAEAGYVEFIERDAKSQSAVKRSKAIHAIRFLGMDNGLEEVTMEAISDHSPKVRTEAIFAIAGARNRAEALGVLKPMVHDEDQAVITAANFAISRLEG